MIVLEEDSVIVALSFEELQTLIGALNIAAKQEHGRDIDMVNSLNGSFSILLRNMRRKFDN